MTVNSANPRLSIVIIIYRMARQAMNTLYTLSAACQREVSESDYEIVVVENESDGNLEEGQVLALGDNFRYLRRAEAGVSPVHAVNLSLSECRGDYVGLMIDGARMVTPRVVRYALDAFAVTDNALVAVPGYHLGHQEHHYNVSSDYDEATEQALLATVNWRGNSYLLFDIACLSGANPHGVFHPFIESNCMFASKANYERIGGADERFQLPGGGALNLHMFSLLGHLPGTRLFVMPGEGSFHQFHGGVTTVESSEREMLVEQARIQLEEIWQGTLKGMEREAVMIGAVTGPAMPHLQWSAKRGRDRFERMRREQRPEWPDEPVYMQHYEKIGTTT